MSISKDKYISFFIDNYQDIEALLEIYNHAKANIPSLIDREMKRYIEGIDFENVDVHYEDGTLWWCDPEKYDLEQGKGPYFSYESRWDSLFAGNDPEDASFLYLYVDVGNLKQKSKKKEYIDKWIEALKKESNRLKKQQCNIISPVDYDDPYLVKYFLHREVNMATLADRDKLKEVVRKTIKSFTENCLLILKDFT